MVQQQIMPGQQQVMLGQQQVMPGQQQVMPDQQPSPSSLSHSWNNSWPAQSTFHQQQILRQQIKQEVEKQRQKQQQQLPSSSQTSVVSMAGSFSPPTNLVHLFIPAHWKNYPRILHGAIEEVLEGSRMQNEQKIEMRRVLIETIVNGRVPSESIQNSAIQIRKDMIFSYLDKVKANMICVLGEAQSAVPPDVSSKSYMELRKRKKAAVNAETQTRSLNGSDDPVLLKKVKLEPGTLDVGSAATDDDLYLETEPVLQVGALSGDRFATPDATSDCLLIVQGRSFHLNKGLLAVNSIVLREWLTNQVQLEVNDLDPKEFLQLMNFIYPSEEQCVITKENIETLLKLAARFQMAEVLKRCEKCLMDRSSAPQNTLAKQLYLAQEYGLVNLKDVCVKRCTSMSDLKSIQAEKEYKMLVDKTIVELVENITRNCC
uniref:BTB domain-containing protein n=1 Tax=Ditylenchus dipsaci TaxID=166011 RepID=A0A915CUX7_9BILA